MRISQHAHAAERLRGAPTKPPVKSSTAQDQTVSPTLVLGLDLASDPRGIEGAVNYLVKRLRTLSVEERKLNLNVRVSLTEAIANAMIHGNRRDPALPVRVEVTSTEDKIQIRVMDQGVGFDPERVPDPTLPENRERSGGRGVFLLRSLMDEVEYNECGNVVKLVLNRNKETETPSS